jgi:hypothetical protein
MPKTAAERQRAWRQRRNHRVAGLEAAAAAHEGTVARLTAELESALADNERLAALACKHPSAAVSGGRCMACQSDVW